MNRHFEKVSYVVSQARKRYFSKARGCPNCGGVSYATLDRKVIVSELRECENCRLMYRFPVDTEGDNQAFYQSAYKQGFTTNMPDANTLANLLNCRFVGHEKSYDTLIKLLELVGVSSGARIFDFGCSWGFGSWQFAEHGWTVCAYEISVDRANYARSHLKVDCENDFAALEARSELVGSFDVFFSNHVIEHVPSPSRSIQLAMRLVKPGGFYIAITPNGSMSFRERAPQSWHKFWGKVHPNLISDTYWATAFMNCDHFVGSLPSDIKGAESWSRNGGQLITKGTDPELVCIARL